jgi:hypothetical protein
MVLGIIGGGLVILAVLLNLTEEKPLEKISSKILNLKFPCQKKTS